MENHSCRKSEEVLAELYRNAHLALQSIVDIMPQVDDEEVKAELESQHEEYERFAAHAAMLARDKGIELKEPNAFKKAMMWSSIKMNTLTNNSRSHIADMMVQGTVMGNSALRTSLGDMCPDDDKAVYELASDILEREEQFEKKWKEYL
jgi:ferritin-like protein